MKIYPNNNAICSGRVRAAHRSTCDHLPAICDAHPTGCDRLPMTCDAFPGACDTLPTTCDGPPTGRDAFQTTCDGLNPICAGVYSFFCRFFPHEKQWQSARDGSHPP